MNIRTIDGRLTKDAEIRTNKNTGNKYLFFSIANNAYVREEQVTTYFNVISYDEHDIENVAKFTKGKVVLVIGKANEVMTIKDGNTYLNRSIMACHIELFFYALGKDNSSQAVTYKDVIPASVETEVQYQNNTTVVPAVNQMPVNPQPTPQPIERFVSQPVSQPTPQPVSQVVNPAPTYQAQMPYNPDELPF